MKYYVYVLFSIKDKKLYVGYTQDIQRRFSEHIQGNVPATWNRRPLELIYYEVYTNPIEAKRREKYLKGGNGRAQLKQQINLTLKSLGYKYL